MRCSMLIMLYFSVTPLAAAEALRCDDPRYRVEAASKEIAARTCRSIAAARDSLSSCGVRVPESLEIKVVDIIKNVNGSCLGLYHCDLGQIEILSPKAMAAKRATDGAFAGISDDALWDSVLVHELTHAAYQDVDCPFQSCIATDEYAGHVMQVQSLPPEELERFGDMVNLKGAPNGNAISALMYFMAPERFAKYAWLHFQSQPDPCRYMQLIMAGEVFFDRKWP